MVCKHEFVSLLMIKSNIHPTFDLCNVPPTHQAAITRKSTAQIQSLSRRPRSITTMVIIKQQQRGDSPTVLFMITGRTTIFSEASWLLAWLELVLEIGDKKRPAPLGPTDFWTFAQPHSMRFTLGAPYGFRVPASFPLHKTSFCLLAKYHTYFLIAAALQTEDLIDWASGG